MPSFWTSKQSDVGAIHEANRAAENYCHEHVLVFVHGVNARASDWWLPKNDMYNRAFAAYQARRAAVKPEDFR